MLSFVSADLRRQLPAASKRLPFTSSLTQNLPCLPFPVQFFVTHSQSATKASSETEYDEMDRTPISQLPDHLLLKIGGWLRQRWDLRALTLTSKRFCNLFEKELYRIDTTGKSTSRSLKRVTDECDYVLLSKLLRFGCCLDVHCSCLEASGEGLTVLVRAIRDKHFGLAAVLIFQGVTVDKAPKASLIPVFLALKKDKLDLFKLMITVGNADLTVLNQNGHGLLTAASRKGDTEAVRYLLSYPSRLNMRNAQKSTPFHEAILKGHFELFLLLLGSPHTSPGMLDENGTTPLQLACPNGRLNYVRALLDDGRTMTRFYNITPSSLVLDTLRAKHFNLVLLLLTHKNAVHPCAMVFPLACEMKKEIIAWKVLEMVRPSKEQACDWKNYAEQVGFGNLATMITHQFGLEPK